MNSSNFSFEDKVITTEKFSKELDYPIQSIVYLENKQNFIVLYDMDSNIRKWGQFPNIICLNSKGEKIWTVELPTTSTGDSYCQMELEDGKLIADSWRSYSCEIDVNTGRIINKLFFK
jgi:outer membrane protein assembly factor BamB